MMPDPDVVAHVRQVDDTYRALSQELLLEDWLGRSFGASYADNDMRLTEAVQ